MRQSRVAVEHGRGGAQSNQWTMWAGGLPETTFGSGGVGEGEGGSKKMFGPV